MRAWKPSPSTFPAADDGLNANGSTGGFGAFGNGMPGFGRDGERTPPEGLGKPAFAEGAMPEPPQGMEPGAPQEGFSGSADSGSGETWIRVSGGSVTVVNDTARDADGFDSNGDIIISGGDVRISLVNSGSNSALDYGSESGGVMEISGGTVIACGSYAMAEGFDSTSTQCAILYNVKRGVAAGRTFSLEDSEGNVLLSYEVPCSFSSVILSSPELKLGETYTVVIGDTAEEMVIGDTAEEITLNEISASYGDVQSEGFGGNMNWGDGMQFRPHRAQPFGRPPETGEP